MSTWFSALIWTLIPNILLLTVARAVSSDTPNSPSHTCGDLIREARANRFVQAIKVYDCFITVPFNPAVASQVIRYWNDTLQFQSTLDYIKQPPLGYQQPAVDLLAGLGEIEITIKKGGFANQYQFEAALQNVLFSANDAHLDFNAGVLSAFKFGSAWGLTSISVDGVQLPKVYLTDDLKLNQTKSTTEPWQPSAISHIDGINIVDYLSRFAGLNSPGTLEPHADWNLIMDNPVLDVLYFAPLWGGAATFYPGDTFSYTFENGSILNDTWLAVYNDPGDTGPLETGGDFYNFFVLGLYPASYSAPVIVNNTDTGPLDPVPTSLSAISNAFPQQPDIAQEDLTETGWITGYFLRDASLAVLSIPTFFADGKAIQAFTNAVQQFIARAKTAGMKKVLIDLQQNQGGDVLLAYSVFKEFFPSTKPYAGSVMRAHTEADEIGSRITSWWNEYGANNADYINATSDEWIATTRLNAITGRYFSSWSEFFGPHYDGAGNFTSVERMNTSDRAFDYSALGAEEPPVNLLSPYSGDAPWHPEDISILSDGLCASACSIFVEMMRQDAGVKNIVIGGRPNYGPMQTPSGSRGARFYSLDELDADIENAVAISSDPPIELQNHKDANFFRIYGGISLRAQVRKGETIPLAMQFEAADCRIFLTPNTFNNFTNLWKYAADAMWVSPQLCVRNSTGYATTNKANPSSIKPAPVAAPPAAINYTRIGTPFLNVSAEHVPFLVYSGPMPDANPPVEAQRLPSRNPSTNNNPAWAIKVNQGQTPTISHPGDGQKPQPHPQPRPVHPDTAPPAKRQRRKRSTLRAKVAEL